jgi:hypothetical protein
MKEATRIIKNARFDATSMTGNRDAPAQQSGLEAKSLTPRLVAKRSGDGTCQIAVALPDLTALTKACGIEDALLKKARVRLFDGNGFWPGRRSMRLRTRNVGYRGCRSRSTLPFSNGKAGRNEAFTHCRRP